MQQMQENKIEGLVLNIFEKNEFDAVVKVLSQNSILFLLVKGFFKPNNKNKNNILVGSISQFEYFVNYGKNNYFLLKKATLLFLFDYTDTRHQQNLVSLFNILNQLEVPNEKFFLTYKEYLKEKDYFHTTLLLTFLLNIIFKINGQSFNHNVCSICSTNKHIYCLNLYEGGMLCYKHKKNNSITELNVLKAFYYLDQEFELYKRNCDEVTNNTIFLFMKEFSHY